MSEISFDFDLIVIGAGYGGFDAAKHASENGLKKVGFNEKEINGILGNNWFNFYKKI